jgi:hypothetical protein
MVYLRAGVLAVVASVICEADRPRAATWVLGSTSRVAWWSGANRSGMSSWRFVVVGFSVGRLGLCG